MLVRHKTAAQWIAISLFSLGTPAALAASQSAVTSSSFSIYPTVVTLSAGTAWEHVGETQTFFLTPSIEKTYAANHSRHTLTDGEIFLGKQMPLAHHLQGQLGLALAATSNAKLSGDIWDDADQQFNNFNYQYKIRHTHFAAKGKLLGDYGYMITPWISASLGVALNRASSYSSTPTIPQAVATPDFNSNTTTAFTYTVGVGIQAPVTTNWQVGVGYEFSDWGKSQLDRASNQTLGNGLTLNHLYTNSVMFNLTHIS